MDNHQQQTILPIDINEAMKGVPELAQIISGQHFHPAALPPATMHNLHFVECRFSQLELTEWQVEQVRFDRCQFEQITLHGGRLQHCLFLHCQLTGLQATQLQGGNIYSYKSDWQQITLQQCQMERFDIQQGSWSDCKLENCHCAYWSLVEAQVCHLQRLGGEDQDWSFYQSTLTACHWRDIALVRWVAGSSHFSDCSVQLVPGKGPVWFKCQLERCDLSQQSLPWASFHQSQLTECDLSGCDLSGAVLSEASFTECALQSGRLQGVQAQGSAFIRCQLAETQFSNALMKLASFTDCDLANCGWQQADLRGACIQAENLPAGLEQARLHGAQLPPGQSAVELDERLQAIDHWYTEFQPGPDTGLPFPSLPSGASRYV